MFLDVITINVAPCSKPRMTKRDRWAKRQCVLKFFAFRDAVRQFQETHAISWWSFEIEFYIPMPKSWSKKKKSLHNGQPHNQRPDLDNYIKAWCDSVYKEDAVVWRFKASKRWTDKEGHIKLSNL